MFRFGLRSSARPVAMSAPGMFRFQGQGAPAGGAMGATDPALDIYDIKENVTEGKHIRIAYRPGMRNVAITNYPQLGPMKIDPNDPTPQFDYEKRTTCRLKPYEMAAMLSVMESKMASATLSTRHWDLTFGPNDTGFALKGSIARNQGSDERDNWEMLFSKTTVTQLYRFMDRSLQESFGFPKKKVYIYQQTTTQAPMMGNRGMGTGANHGGGNFRRNDGGGNFQRRDGGNFQRRDGGRRDDNKGDKN